MKKFLVFPLLILLLASPVLSRPKYSLHIGYSFWTLNVLKDLIEEKIGDELQTQLQNQIKNDFPYKTLGEYTQDVDFDSSGGGIVVELRIYPSGENGSFSIGFSYARIDSKIDLSGEIRQDFESGDYLTATANSNFIHKYSAFSLDLRWDLFPEGRVHPYFSFGGGLAPLNGNFSYSASGYSYINNHKNKYDIGDETKNLDEIEDINISIIPVLFANLGIKVDLYQGISAYADGGLWNGFLFRVGLIYSF